MRQLLTFVFSFATFLLVPLNQGVGQRPSTEVLSLSLRTIGKALTGCRESYIYQLPNSSKPFLESVVTLDEYQADLRSLNYAQSFISAAIARPEKLTGRILVAILSLSDDFSVGVGSTRVEVLRHLALDAPTANRGPDLALTAERLNLCQRSLFNAGDDFVGLVLKYVGAEDDALRARALK
jgi:hypothetical protein